MLGGSSGLRDARIDLEEVRGRWTAVTSSPSTPTADDLAFATELRGRIDSLEPAVRSERWRLFIVGFPTYVLLGGVFATMVADNALEALAVGFGWTAILDRFGLKRASEERASDISELSQKATAAVDACEALQTELDQLRSAQTVPADPTDETQQSAQPGGSPPQTVTATGSDGGTAPLRAEIARLTRRSLM